MNIVEVGVWLLYVNIQNLKMCQGRGRLFQVDECMNKKKIMEMIMDWSEKRDILDSSRRLLARYYRLYIDQRDKLGVENIDIRAKSVGGILMK